MKTILLYEPAMCCPTGICGPGIDPELLRISGITDFVNKDDKPIGIQRYNLKDHPMAFVESPMVHQMIAEGGIEVLPLAIFDGKIIYSGGYPPSALICEYLDIPEKALQEAAVKNTQSKPCVKPKIKLSDLKVRPYGDNGVHVQSGPTKAGDSNGFK